jgi:hypothetical protein
MANCSARLGDETDVCLGRNHTATGIKLKSNFNKIVCIGLKALKTLTRKVLAMKAKEPWTDVSIASAHPGTTNKWGRPCAR